MEHTITERTADNKNEKQNDDECCIISAIKRKEEAQPLRLEDTSAEQWGTGTVVSFSVTGSDRVVRHCYYAVWWCQRRNFSSLNLNFNRRDANRICGRKLSQGGRNIGDGQRSSCVFRSDSYNKCAAGDKEMQANLCLYRATDTFYDHKCFRADTCYFLCRLCTIIFCGSGTPCHRTESFRLAWYSCTYGKMYTGSYA